MHLFPSRHVQYTSIKARDTSSSDSNISTYPMSNPSEHGTETFDSDDNNDKENVGDEDELNEDSTVLIRTLGSSPQVQSSSNRTPRHDFAIAVGARPRSEGGRQTLSHGRPRRVINSEQENADETIEFEHERLAYFARQRRAGSSVLERTPPGSSRLERFM